MTHWDGCGPSSKSYPERMWFNRWGYIHSAGKSDQTFLPMLNVTHIVYVFLNIVWTLQILFYMQVTDARWLLNAAPVQGTKMAPLYARWQQDVDAFHQEVHPSWSPYQMTILKLLSIEKLLLSFSIPYWNHDAVVKWWVFGFDTTLSTKSQVGLNKKGHPG